MENIGWKKPIRFGRWDFGSVGETVACIKDLLRKLEDGWGDMYGVNLELAVMYQSVLPYRERNAEKSKGFLERCLKARPYSSRANFKMGEYWIFQRGNIPEAIKHLELAVSHAPLNAKARMDLIKALLAYPVENREKILKLIDDAVSSHVLYPWRLDTFRFLKGCVFFMGYDPEDLPDHRNRAAAEWVKSVETCPDLFRNENINSQVRRFKWAGGIISEHKIKSTIRESDLSAEEKRRFFAALDPMEGPWRELSDVRIRTNGAR
jgi:tetratricopeptide (TPR) repeat protein